jgi:SAM-dependent methyltransferase
MERATSMSAAVREWLRNWQPPVEREWRDSTPPSLCWLLHGNACPMAISVDDIEILPFPDRSFDLVTGFNSFQYAGNPVVALSEAGRVVAADGTVVVVIWGSPEGMEAVAMIGALGSLLPPPPPGTPGPFALSEEVALRQFAVDAGLRPLAVFDVDCPFVYPDETTAVRGFASTGVAARAMELTSEQTVQKAFADAVAAFRQPDGSYRIGASFRCLLARP